MNEFWKGHGLGNDYLVMDPGRLDFRLTPARIRAICDRHTGVGGDGLLVPGPPTRSTHFGVRIFNPDGSEAEKSGNGLRIFARWLYATRRTRRTRFRIATRGGDASVELRLDGFGEAGRARVSMGAADFRPAALPCTLRVPELVDQPVEAAGRRLRFTGLSVGNPHCVVFGTRWSEDDLLALGPALETHEIFPRRTNVQLAAVAGSRRLDVLVWERGVGRTRASGSSACAAAAAALRGGLVRSPVAVHMPGGVLQVDRGPDGTLQLEGDVAEVARGRLSAAFVRELGRKA